MPRPFLPALAVLAAAVAVLMSAPVAGASPTQETQFQDDPMLVYKPADEVARTLDEIRAFGVDRIRVSVFWLAVAPSVTSTTKPDGFDGSNPAAYPRSAWKRYDTIVRLAAAKGLSVNLEVMPPAPAWATGDPGARADLKATWYPSPEEFGAFTTAVGRRYDGTYEPCGKDPYCDPLGLAGDVPASGPLPRVNFWSIWNEPNQAGWLTPQNAGGVPSSPRIYRSLVKASFAALVATGHGPPKDRILIGELAPKGQKGKGVSDNVKPLAFVRGLYCVDTKLRPLRGASAAVMGCPQSGQRQAFVNDNPGLFLAGGFGHHPYALLEPPSKGSLDKDYIVLADLPRLTKTLDGIFSAYGQPRKRRLPLYLTEYGYQTKPPDPFGVSPSRQAAYLNEAEYLAYRNKRVVQFSQFLLVDDGPVLSEPVGSPRYWGNFQTGLIGLDGLRKPAYAAFRLPFHVPKTRDRGERFAVWGALRRVANPTARRARVEYRRGTRGAFTALRTLKTRGARGFITGTVRVPASGQLHLAWTSPSGEVVLSRVIAVRKG